MTRTKLSSEQKQEIVNKIRSSANFRKAPTSSALLQYLHEATLREVDITETVINIEFFGAKESAEKTTPKVRVNIYNLRKKLEQYYEQEGLHDVWHLDIRKGQYQVFFEKKVSQQRFIQNTTWKTLAPWCLFIIAAIAFIITNKSPQTPELWHSFLKKDNRTQLYIGDMFGIVGPTTFDHLGWTRDYNINSLNDYYRFMKQHPELENDYKAAPFTLANGSAVTSTREFQRFFQERKRDFTIRFSTKSTTSEIKEGNAIFIGNIWNNKQFIPFFNDANPHCKLDRGYLHLVSEDYQKKSYLIKSPETTIEYAIVSKYPAPEETHHLLFFSQHGVGVNATTEYFTCLDSMKHFSDKYLQENEYFTAIFKVNGQDRTNISIEVDTVIVF